MPTETPDVSLMITVNVNNRFPDGIPGDPALGPTIDAKLAPIAAALAAIGDRFTTVATFPQLLTDLEARLMSALSDKIAAATAAQKAETDALTAAVARVKADFDARTAADTTLTDKIAELQALVDSGGASQADLDALDALAAQQAANRAVLASFDVPTPPPSPTPPTPPPAPGP